jgi:cell division protein DivIC
MIRSSDYLRGVKWLRNRYVIIAVLFLVWISFFDQNSLIYQYKLRREIRNIEANKRFYKSEIEKLSRENRELFGDVRNLEKFGREKFYMKKADEDLILIDRVEE